ncbi:hypothetical protein DL546_003532 [Coniochaeta pulveracea]|uniref:Uncharacterized protein n=1 Tax=Coniochaeta pulveracea TaxID=177199 RepID=A0A420Y513_9PEZI|nr:hypothetical protein DL546_003532 [Coniochaeta pulveracea]
MSGESSSPDAGAPKLNLTAEEKHVYGQLFRQADTDGVGVVTGEIAVKFFDKTRLDSRVLGEIWQIADRENRGFLTPAGFGVVLRLIGHAQAGREPSLEIALQPGPLPRFDGFTPTPLPTLPNPLPGPPPGPPPTVQGLQPQGTGSAPIRIPPLTPEKVAQYASIFERQPLQNGNMLPGEQAKQIFEKSGLPNEILGRIWMLADTEQRGALVQTEFVIAMHLLSSLKTGVLRGLPNILPAALYEAATRRAPVGGPVSRQPTASPTSTSAPLSAIPRQLSGQAPLAQMRTGSPLGRPPAIAPQSTGDWLITPADKARFDVLYAELDKTNKGFITGEEAVPFFSQSNLPEDTLAQIWDLADFRSEGRLNKDQFAVAMYLIRQQRSRKDGANLLPTALPLNLIPPSMRNQAQAPATTASPFDAPPPTAAPSRPAVPAPKPSHLDDLFGLDSPHPSAPTQVPVATGASATGNDPFSTSASPPPPVSPIRPSATGSQFKPFVPSSSFGRNLLPQGTGGSNSSASAIAPRIQSPPAAVEDDLLGGENDTEISNKLNKETTELANLSNQVGSLSKQMHDVQGKRSSMQSELDQITAQKKNFEQRLAQLRSTYDKEAQDVRALETQLTAARNDTKKLQTEMAMLDGTYHDLQNQRAQVLAALQADQQENAALKERIRAVNEEIAQLKPQIEKLKSDARQQKGLVAINKKQFATNEGERDKLKTEAEDLARSNDEMARQASSSSPPPAQVASPTLSTASGNNPFFRRTGSTDIAGAFASPSLKAFHDKSFDDVFGPSPFPPAGQTSTPPPPPNAFRPQNTGTSTASFASGSFATPTSTTPNISRQGTLTTEPPAPPESRQLSASHLPFTAENQESLSSSRQVSPPLSRVSQADTGSVEARSSPLASPAEITRSEPSTSTDGSESETAKNSAESQPSQEEPTSHETGAENNSWWGTKDQEGGEGVIASATAAVSHVAEGVLHAATGVKDNLFGSSDPDSSSKAPPAADETADHFAGVDQAKAKEDFDSAFASFKSARAKAPATDNLATTSSTAHSEFPPVSSLEIEDDDSDSDSDRGFDDDFAPASPPQKSARENTETSKPTSPVASKPLPVESSASPDARSIAPVPVVEQPQNTTRYEA